MQEAFLGLFLCSLQAEAMVDALMQQALQPYAAARQKMFFNNDMLSPLIASAGRDGRHADGGHTGGRVSGLALINERARASSWMLAGGPHSLSGCVQCVVSAMTAGW